MRLEGVVIRVITFLIILISSGTSSAEKSNIGIVTTYYAFDEIREFCRWKHHGSSPIVDTQFQEWKKQNKSILAAAFLELEKEAANDEVKAQKLPHMETYLRNIWQDRYINMDAEISGYLCFFKGQAFEFFQSMLNKEL